MIVWSGHWPKDKFSEFFLLVYTTYTTHVQTVQDEMRQFLFLFCSRFKISQRNSFIHNILNSVQDFLRALTWAKLKKTLDLSDVREKDERDIKTPQSDPIWSCHISRCQQFSSSSPSLLLQLNHSCAILRQSLSASRIENASTTARFAQACHSVASCPSLMFRTLSPVSATTARSLASSPALGSVNWSASQNILPGRL